MDVFYTSSNEPEAYTPAEAAAPGGVVLAGSAYSVNSSSSARPATGDETVWHAWLEQNGFSAAEAGRLIFERLRPRDEGVGRV
jgi:hypothetical protein